MICPSHQASYLPATHNHTVDFPHTLFAHKERK
jgi:hypothetical protein